MFLNCSTETISCQGNVAPNDYAREHQRSEFRPARIRWSGVSFIALGRIPQNLQLGSKGYRGPHALFRRWTGRTTKGLGQDQTVERSLVGWERETNKPYTMESLICRETGAGFFHGRCSPTGECDFLGVRGIKIPTFALYSPLRTPRIFA